MSRGMRQQPDWLEAVALLVIDAQEGVLPDLPEADPLLDRCTFAIEAARLFQLRILVAERAPERYGRTAQSLIRAAGNPQVFRRRSFSALQAEDMVDYLRKQGIYHLLLCGTESTVSIYQTALQAIDLDLDATVLTDAVGCRRPGDEGAALASLARSGCHLLPSETVFFSLIGEVDHPLYKSFSKLVRLAGGLPPESDRQAPAPQREAREPREQPAPASREEPSRDEDEAQPESETAADDDQPDRQDAGQAPRENGERRGRRRNRNRRRKWEDRGPADASAAPVSADVPAPEPAQPRESAPEPSAVERPRPKRRPRAEQRPTAAAVAPEEAPASEPSTDEPAADTGERRKRPRRRSRRKPEAGESSGPPAAGPASESGE
jgi:nicotinamidase-related amidase